jgi:FkbM family methyltransferase
MNTLLNVQFRTMNKLIRTIFEKKAFFLKKSLYFLRELLTDIHATKSYSQEGEDMVLRRIFAGKKCGFYVDVGAHHPHRFSNTNFFYKRGWRGINIEPNPEAIRAFHSSRQRDINIQCGVSENSENLTYYFFNEAALNTFDIEIVKWRLANTPYKLSRTSEIHVKRLDYILEQYLPAGVEIDFLTIDVEGLDFKVLKSNNWKSYRPKCVLVEVLNTSLEGAMQGEIFQFMQLQGYELFAKTYNTLIFRELNNIRNGQIL